MTDQSWQPYWERAGENLRAAEALLREAPPLPNAEPAGHTMLLFTVPLRCCWLAPIFVHKEMNGDMTRSRLSLMSSAFAGGNCWMQNIARPYSISSIFVAQQIICLVGPQGKKLTKQ